MIFSEFALTIPGWLTLVMAAASVLLSIQMFRWYLEATDPFPYPYFIVKIPFLAEKDENPEEER